MTRVEESDAQFLARMLVIPENHRTASDFDRLMKVASRHTPTVAWDGSWDGIRNAEVQMYEPWDGHNLNALETMLRDHYLAGIECDHDGKRDRASCQCSLIDLGWYPSVGDAVQSWVDHVMAVVRGGQWSTEAILRRAKADLE